MSNVKFHVENEVKDLGLKGTYFLVSGIQNMQTNELFEEFLKKTLAEVVPKVTQEWIDSNRVLNGFRELHNQVGRSNKKFISSPENLYKYILKHKTIPRINLLVDIYNIISIKYSLALGAHDLNNIHGNIKLAITKGDEKFIPLGQSEPKLVQIGDYAYIDDSNEILCHLEVRQVEKTKITTETNNAFFIVQGNEATDNYYITTAVDELTGLIKEYCGGVGTILLNI